MLRENFIERKARALALTLVLIFITSLSSCEEKGLDLTVENREEIAATFNTTINTPACRASGTLWEAGDSIGIFAVTSGSTLSDLSIYNTYKNIKHINNTEGTIADFQAAGDAIIFPHTKDMLDFRAYYPYSATGVIGGTSSIGDTLAIGEWGTGSGSDFDLSIDVSQQSPLSAIDVMYASATGHNSDNPNVGLSFSHSLSQLMITVTAEEGIVLEGATVNILNAVTQGSMSLDDGIVTPSAEISGDTITPVISYDSAEDKIRATAIMLPGWNLSDAQIHIQTASGNNYIWQPGEYQLLPNIRRSYNLKLTHNTVRMITDGSTIDAWLEESNETTEEITPDNSVAVDPGDIGDTYTGNGIFDSPYSVAQAIANQGETEVWVEGYMIGFAIGVEQETYKLSINTINTLALESIVLADISTEQDILKMIPIQLGTDSEAQAQLNLYNNSNLLGSKVKVLCNLEELFNSPGGNFITDFAIIQ